MQINLYCGRSYCAEVQLQTTVVAEISRGVHPSPYYAIGSWHRSTLPSKLVKYLKII